MAKSIAVTRLEELFDPESFVEIKPDFSCGVAVGYGTVEGKTVCAFSQDREVLSGAVSLNQAKKMNQIISLAAEIGCPLVGIYDSLGAQVTEGVSVLEAYSEIMALLHRVSGVIPQISLILGTCVGTSALMAESADILIGQKDAAFYVLSNRESAEEAMKSGNLHLLEKDEHKAIDKARTLLSILPANNLAPLPSFAAGSGKAISEDLHGLDLCEALTDAFIELQPQHAECMTTGLGVIDGKVAGFVACGKSELCANGANKAARFIHFCDSFSIPVVTLLHSWDLKKNQNSNGVRYFAKLSHSYAEATTPKITLITDAAVGFSYVAFAGASADITMAWKNAIVSALPIPAAVEFLWHDKLKGVENTAEARKKLENEYKNEEAAVSKAAETGAIDLVIDPAQTRQHICHALQTLTSKRVNTLPKKHGNMPL